MKGGEKQDSADRATESPSGSPEEQRMLEQLGTHQAELEAGQRRYHVLFDRAPVGYFVLNRSGRVEDVNERGAELVGVSSLKLKGRPFVVYLVPEHHMPFFSHLKDTFEARGGSRRQQIRLVTSDKAERWIMLESRVEDTASDDPVCYAAAFDITEEVRTRRRMEMNEERFRLIFESVNDAVYVSRIEPSGRPGKFTAVNGRAVRALGYSEEELLSMSPTNINAPSTRDRIPELMKDIRQNARGVFEVRHQRKDGSEFPVEISSRLVVMDGETRILSVARDITERKEAEARSEHLQRVLQVIADADQILLRETDPAALIEKTTELFATERGYEQLWVALRGEDGSIRAEAEAGIGEEFTPFVDHLRKGWIPPCVQRRRDSGDVSYLVRDRESVCAGCPLRNSYGTGLPVTLQLQHEDGKFGDMVATISGDEVSLEEELDLLEGFSRSLSFALYASDQRRAEQKSREQAERLLEENRLLLREIHHRAKNDLSRVRGLLYLRQAEVESDEAREVLEEAMNRISGLAAVYDRLHRLESGAVVDMVSMIEELLGDLRETVLSRQIRIETDLKPCSLPREMALDLGIVLNELLMNATKYAFGEAEAGTLEIRCGPGDSGNVILTVRDDGPGFPKEMLAGDRPSFGLQMAEDMVARHGGSLRLYNDRGASVTLTLPVDHGPGED